MRPIPVLAAAALLASLASAAAAQPAREPVPPPPSSLPPAVEPEPTAAAADMAALDARIETDGAALLRRIDADLVIGNARMRAIRPALAFKGPTFLPAFYVGVPKPYPR